MKTAARTLRHRRVRALVRGTADRPRLVVFRGSKVVSAQLVDDASQKVLASVTTQGKKPQPANVDTAKQLGGEIAKRAQAKKISEVVFDRAGFAYHGIVKAIAEGAREGGLKV